MRMLAVKDAKNDFGWLLEAARSGPVAIEAHGRAAVVLLAYEKYTRLWALANPSRIVRGEMSDNRVFQGGDEDKTVLDLVWSAEC